MPCGRPLQAIRVSIIAVLVGLCVVSCGQAHLDFEQHTPITSVHPLLNVPSECGFRPTSTFASTSVGRALAHSAYDKVETTSLGTSFVLHAAGVGWALPNIRNLVDHDAVAAMTAEDLVLVQSSWFVPLSLDPWLEEQSVVPVSPMGR